MSSLCQSIYCRTSCPFCLQVRSLKQKRLRRRANKSRKEKIPARRSPGALIRHSKNNFSKKQDDFSLTVLDNCLTYLKHFEPSRVRLVECGPLLGSQSRPSGRAGNHLQWASTPTGPQPQMHSGRICRMDLDGHPAS